LRVDGKENTEIENKDGQEEEKSGRDRRSFMSSMRERLFGGASSDKPMPKPIKAPQIQRQGTLSTDSIFADEPVMAEEAEVTPERRQGPSRLEDRLHSNMQMVIDPRPEARKRWERKMIIQEIRKRGRLTKKEIIMATERESLVKSHWFKTSVKKLSPLARQIAGKNIDEAILQMRFSKKKVAKDVMEHLNLAKNTAIVRHGMGLSKEGGRESEIKPITVILGDGEKKTITDPTSIYIEQAWVNRGPYDTAPDHRARGKINIMRLPYTGLSVVLKEEKTRIREWKDRETRAKRQRKSMLWVQLPDRPISAQNQYYNW
jgi:ribosomal protein L22